MTASSCATNDATLYNRLGGDLFIQNLVCDFFDEILENPDLRPFFKNISVSAMKTHQVKLFRVIFGKDEEKPEEEHLLDFMLRTHTRLFRELGLNATHFDMVTNCLVQGLKTFQVDQSIIEECLAILVPLRDVFEYGAQVAAREKLMDEDTKKTLPVATPKTIGTNLEVVLPEYSKIEIPEWLPEALKKGSLCGDVRTWTCDLTDRFGVEGDAQIADTFLDQPYMDHHVYLVAFLQLAFLPKEVDKDHQRMILEIVQYPRGRQNAKLSADLFVRMITQFQFTCHKMGASNYVIQQADHKLRTYIPLFGKKTIIVGGVCAPHVLCNIRRMNDGLTFDMHSETASLASLSMCSMDTTSDTSSTHSSSQTLMSKILKSKKSELKSRKCHTTSKKINCRSGAFGWLRGTIWAN